MKNAADVMSFPVIYVMEETPVREIARVLIEHSISAVPVIGSSGRLVGMVSEGDLVSHSASTDGKRCSWWLDMIEKNPTVSEGFQTYLERHGLRAKDVMSNDVVTVGEDMSIAAIAELLQRKGIKRVPVMHKDQMVGIVSRANLLTALSHLC
jgi:CBS domain-containing protein